MRGGDPSSWQATGRPPLLTALIILAWQCPPYPQRRTLLGRLGGKTKTPLWDPPGRGDEQSLRPPAAPRRLFADGKSPPSSGAATVKNSAYVVCPPLGFGLNES